MDIVGLLDPSDGGNFLTKRTYLDNRIIGLIEKTSYSKIPDISSYNGNLFAVISPLANGVKTSEIIGFIQETPGVELVAVYDASSVVVKVTDSSIVNQLKNNVTSDRFDASFFTYTPPSNLRDDGSSVGWVIDTPKVKSHTLKPNKRNYSLGDLTIVASPYSGTGSPTEPHVFTDWEIYNYDMELDTYWTVRKDTRYLTTKTFLAIADFNGSGFGRALEGIINVRIRYHSEKAVSEWSEIYSLRVLRRR